MVMMAVAKVIIVHLPISDGAEVENVHVHAFIQPGCQSLSH